MCTSGNAQTNAMTQGIMAGVPQQGTASLQAAAGGSPFKRLAIAMLASKRPGGLGQPQPGASPAATKLGG